MDSNFDIIEYLSGSTGYVLDKAVLKNIALDRNVANVTDFSELSTQDKELLRADLLYVVYLSPNVMASSTNSHGSFNRTIGSQTIYDKEKERLYNIFTSIYKKYNDDKLEEIKNSDGNLQWLDV